MLGLCTLIISTLTCIFVRPHLPSLFGWTAEVTSLKKRICCWISEATKYQDWSDSHYSVLIGCCPFKINQCEQSSYHQWAFHLLWSECGAVWQSETAKIQRCLHELLITDVVILYCDWDSDSLCVVVWDKKMVSDLNHITFSLWVHTWQRDPQRCFLHPLPRTDAVTVARAAKKRR